MEKLIQNAIYLPLADKYIVSQHVHDWVPFKYDGSEMTDAGDWDGYIDGGREYMRAGGKWVMPGSEESLKVEDFCIYESSTDHTYRQRLLWGSYGKSGREPLTWRPVISLTTEHLQNILKDMGDMIYPRTRALMEEIITERGEVPEKPIHWTVKLEVGASTKLSEKSKKRGKKSKLLEEKDV